jgi:GAF domain
VKPQSTGTPDKPVLDEGAFQQLLSAAFVLQQHKERLQEKGALESAFGEVLTRVVAIQEQIRSRHLDLQAVATLVARRVREITDASGAAIGILSGNDLEYFAATGSASGELGARAPFELSVAAECLHTGLVLRCPNAETDARLKFELCRPLNIRALIAAPILFETKVAGVLELHFAQPNSFHEQDVRVCQLLVALLAEAVAKEKDAPPETTLPGENAADTPAAFADTASMWAALEKIKPQLQRLAGPARPAAPAASPTVCIACGGPLAEDESFCGSCGVSRQSPSTWSSLWDRQREAEKSAKARQDPAAENASDALDILPSELEDIVAQFSMDPDDVKPIKRTPEEVAPFSVPSPDAERVNGNGATPKDKTLSPLQTPYVPRPDAAFVTSTLRTKVNSDALFPSFNTKTSQPDSQDETTDAEPVAPKVPARAALPWTSAGRTRKRIESKQRTSYLASTWRKHRANIYVAASAVLLLAVLFGWGSISPPAATTGTPATGRNALRKVPPKPELSTSDKILVDLGLAEAPSAPAYTGNPEAKVWIDVHTALYYCVGSELYGKTPGGRFTSQGDAQQDSFQSASRRPCE